LCDQLSVKKPTKSEDSIESDPRFGHVYQMLVNKIGGRFKFFLGLTSFEPGSYQEQRAKDQHQLNTRMETKFVPNKDESVSVQMAAEGIRKLGILQLLLENKQLNPGTSGTLFWDEPETNMNPKLVRIMVEMLLELARNGQQIVLATHDYVLLKWFDLLADKGKEDHVRFHALFQDPSDGKIKLDSTDDYLAITPNAIADAFNDLTREQVKSKMGDLGK
jgi:AAA15 family ATPase/GTPase